MCGRYAGVRSLWNCSREHDQSGATALRRSESGMKGEYRRLRWLLGLALAMAFFVAAPCVVEAEEASVSDEGAEEADSDEAAESDAESGEGEEGAPEEGDAEAESGEAEAEAESEEADAEAESGETDGEAEEANAEEEQAEPSMAETGPAPMMTAPIPTPPPTEPLEPADEDELDEEAFEATGSEDEESLEEEESEVTGQNCMGQPEARWVYHQMLVAKFNPLGAEHYGRVGVCAPLIRNHGMLFDLSHIEFGISHALSPAGMHIGGFLEVSPLSLLILRVTAQGMMYWPFPISRAAYFDVDGYEANIDSDYYPHEDGAFETGWNVNFDVILQARVSLGNLGLVFLDSFSYELWKVGDPDTYYINLRHDMVMQGWDQVIANEAMLMLEIPVHERFSLRVGAYDALRYVPASEQANNSVGLIAMLSWPEVGNITQGMNVFMRLGWYTNRPEQNYGQGVPVIYLGLSYNFDLGSAAAAE